MLRIRQTEQGNMPIVVCDGCGEQIGGAREGVVLYHVFSEEIKQPLGAELYVLHTTCREAFEAEHGGRRFWLGTALDTMPALLGKTLRPKRTFALGGFLRLLRAGRNVAPVTPRLLDAAPGSRA